MLVELSLRQTPESTLQEQIAEQIRRKIARGELPPGSLLPSTRGLARQYHVSRNTVSHAYDRLMGEGYIETVRGVGTKVTRRVPDTCLLVDEKTFAPVDLERGVDRAPIVFCGTVPDMPIRTLASPAIDFWPGRPNLKHFPLAAWRRLADEALTAPASGLVEYGDPAGLLSLREAVAQHVSASRGLACGAERIIITAGTQDAINLIARMLVRERTGVIMENPGYGSAARTFQSYGGRIFPVPVDRDGIDTARLPAHRASIAYVTPSHQFPTGAPLSAERRRGLLEWARSTGAYIVEDDYDSDFNYSRPPLMSLAGADRNRSVIYVGTLSKALGAGVRTGFLVVPPQLAVAARAIKAMTSYGHPWLDQAILARFLQGTAFQRHVRVIRKAYSDTLEHLICRLTETFGPLDLWGTHNGMHVMWKLPEWARPASAFRHRLCREGVHVHTLTSVGAYDEASGYGDAAILLGYAALSRRDVTTAVDTMARVAASSAPAAAGHWSRGPDAEDRAP